MPTAEWLNKYESIQDKLTCKTDLDVYFTEKVIGNMKVDVLDIGTVHFPTGTIFACDPLVELEDTPPFMQTIPAGTYPVKICVVPSKKYGDREIKDANDVAMYLLEEAHVATVNGDAFCAPGYIRLSYATSDDNIREACRRIAEALAKLK